jgi:hypothetical protein
MSDQQPSATVSLITKIMEYGLLGTLLIGALVMLYRYKTDRDKCFEDRLVTVRQTETVLYQARVAMEGIIITKEEDRKKLDALERMIERQMKGPNDAV